MSKKVEELRIPKFFEIDAMKLLWNAIKIIEVRNKIGGFMIGNTKLVLIYRDFRNRAYKELSESKREAFFEYLIDNFK